MVLTTAAFFSLIDVEQIRPELVLGILVVLTLSPSLYAFRIPLTFQAVGDGVAFGTA
jgi:hypothetical protein